MYRTIIAGCNGRERGRGAVSLAHAISVATGARLVLVGVHHQPPLPSPAGYAEQREAVGDELRAVRDEFAPEALIRLESDLSPAHALCQAAAAESADLLVVGARHRRPLQRTVESDHALQVLCGAPCAVAVAPDRVAAHPELHRIGVGIDPTPESALALVMARELAQQGGARLSLYSVVDDAVPGWVGLTVTSSYADALQALVDDRCAAAENLLARLLEDCDDVAAEGFVVAGDPAGELLLATEDLDLLVLGSRRRGPVRRLAVGSTAERVIRNTACPVLLPPRRADAEHADALLAGLVVTGR
jgi:nucleotide-binding universal stress UspA family protein